RTCHSGISRWFGNQRIESAFRGGPPPQGDCQVAWKQVLDVFEVLDSAYVDGQKVADLLTRNGVEDVTVTRVHGEKGYTDFVKAVIPGASGKATGGDAPTLGIIGRHGGIGARPEMIGF